MSNRSTVLSVVVCLLLFALCVPQSFAQGNVGFNLRGGLATPVGNFNEAFNLGFGIHSSVYVEFSPVAALGLGVGFNRFALENLGDSEFDVSGGDASILDICPELRFMAGTGDMGTFAFVIGAGWYRLMKSDLEVTELLTGDKVVLEFDSLSEFGINLSGQGLYPVNDSVKLGAETMYHVIFTDDETTAFFDFLVVLAFTTGT
jgi:hypothetical protein